MMNNFNKLADIAVNEKLFTDYMKDAMKIAQDAKQKVAKPLKRAALKTRIGARKLGRDIIDDPEKVAKQAAVGTAKGIAKGANVLGGAAIGAAGAAARGLGKAVTKVPGALAAAASAPSAIKGVTNFFTGNNPSQQLAGALGKLQGAIDKKIENRTAKSLGLRTENPKTGDNLAIEIGRNPAAGVGIKIPVSGNVGVKFGKTSKFQNMTIYDVPITNNRSIGLLKVGVGDPKDSNVQLYYFDKNNQKVDGRGLGLPPSAILNYSNKVNGWKITDKEPPGIEEFSLTKVKQALQKTQSLQQQTQAGGTTATPTAPAIPGAPTTGTVAAPGAVTGGTATPSSAGGTATAATTAPTTPTQPSTSAAATTPKVGSIFNIEDRFGRIKKYQISAIDNDTVYAFQV